MDDQNLRCCPSLLLQLTLDHILPYHICPIPTFPSLIEANVLDIACGDLAAPGADGRVTDEGRGEEVLRRSKFEPGIGPFATYGATDLTTNIVGHGRGEI